jgi:hypothetical protein
MARSICGQEILVARLALFDQQQLVGLRREAGPRRPVGAAQRELAADDRLHTRIGRGEREFERAEQIARVRDGDRRHALLGGELHQILDLDGAFRERIGGMDPEMDEVAMGHRTAGCGVARSV